MKRDELLREIAKLEREALALCNDYEANAQAASQPKPNTKQTKKKKGTKR
jgi:hypothetical protein